MSNFPKLPLPSIQETDWFGFTAFSKVSISGHILRQRPASLLVPRSSGKLTTTARGQGLCPTAGRPSQGSSVRFRLVLLYFKAGTNSTTAVKTQMTLGPPALRETGLPTHQGASPSARLRALPGSRPEHLAFPPPRKPLPTCSADQLAFPAHLGFTVSPSESLLFSRINPCSRDGGGPPGHLLMMLGFSTCIE